MEVKGFIQVTKWFVTSRKPGEPGRHGTLITKLDYIHNNSVKAGLVEYSEDYRFSSARNYIMDDHSVIKVKTDWN